MELYINNGTDSFLLALKPNTKINLSIYNPMFSNVGLFSQLINVYRTENDRFFNYAAQLQSIQSTKFTFKLLLGTDAIVEGDVKVTDSDQNSIEFYLKSGNSSVAYYTKNTLMSESDFWGTYTTPGSWDETTEGNYPQYPVVLPPIASPDGDVWRSINQITIYPAIYMRHVIDKLIVGLGYQKITDTFDAIGDFNRIALFSPLDITLLSATFSIKNYLPDIPISDFLDEVLFRFNSFIYFSPTTFQAEVLNFSDILLITPDDWTYKYKTLVKLSPASEKQIIFTNSSKDKTDNLSVPQVNEGYIITVATINDLPTPGAHDPWAQYYVTETDRFYQVLLQASGNQMVPGGAHTEAYEFSVETESINSNSYYIIKPLPGVTNAASAVNASTGANTKNFIAQFALESTEGNIEDSILLQIYASVNTGTSTLVTEAYWLNTDTSQEISVGKNRYDISSAGLKKIQFKSLSKSLEYKSTQRLIIKFYSISSNSGREITLRFGGNYSGNYLYTYLETDLFYYYWQEYARLNNVSIGTQSNEDTPTTISPKGKIPTNIHANVNNVIAEITQSTLSKQILGEQSDFEWLVYRGKKRALQDPDIYVPHCNYDDKDLELNSYHNDIESGISPSLILKWNKQKGLLPMTYRNRLPWERYLKRKISMDLELTYNDVFNRPIYKPFSIKGSNIIAEKITLTIDVFDNITNQQVEGYTL